MFATYILFMQDQDGHIPPGNSCAIFLTEFDHLHITLILKSIFFF